MKRRRFARLARPRGGPRGPHPWAHTAIVAATAAAAKSDQIRPNQTKSNHFFSRPSADPRFARAGLGAHDTILRCRMNAAFRSQPERRIYAAGVDPRRNLSCAPGLALRKFSIFNFQSRPRGQPDVLFGHSSPQLRQTRGSTLARGRVALRLPPHSMSA
jgi:hypothetical protein